MSNLIGYLFDENLSIVLVIKFTVKPLISLSKTLFLHELTEKCESKTIEESTSG